MDGLTTGYDFSRAGRHVWSTLKMNWHLGFTAFGGPPVHFKIFHEMFVEKSHWIDEQLYQELFSISQALSGPASTKMLYCINLIHNGFPSALLALVMWSLPGALGMFALSMGISTVGDTLPRAVYALLSGLNAATVGIIALAAVELSDKAVTDHLTRLIVFGTAAAGLLYNALWYIPVLMVASGAVSLVYDYRWIHRPVQAAIRRLRRHSPPTPQPQTDNGDGEYGQTDDEILPHEPVSEAEMEPRVIPTEHRLNFSWKIGTAIIASFFVTFLVVMVLRGTLPFSPLLYRLFANLYLAGTIIFGGGPVVIPLLREYIVAEGWVSPRDFLIGLAIAQAFPGPNFNFAVFLGGLVASNHGYPVAVGSILAFIGIFTPGIVLVHGTMGVWAAIRSKPWIKSVIRGINAGAVGLIYPAVYRIWQVGFIDEGFQSGRSLADDPWWVVVTAMAYIGGRYFRVPPPVSILIGAVLGLTRYAVLHQTYTRIEPSQLLELRWLGGGSHHLVT
ncbi:hypothetical protein S40285_04956 [Stachybotrys chlorohalonatus IBT 40285]|uniref:Chromate transporter n=1 Tax=Stachybotrys chlorohalonatus (strain IBT 40285) TaxID=1283841 RepID=A0A084QUL7_STAC4|nr:hypothetical protein S40285_04956 [Stachybotrys chlorohalonata IBT 40285]